MKRLNLSNLFALMALFAVMFTSVACSSSDDDDEGGGGGQKTDPKEAEVSSEDMMQRLVNTSNSFLSKINSADFNNVARVTNALDDIDGRNVEVWASGCVDDITTIVSNTLTDGYYYQRDARRLWRAANFTGHFTAQNGRWMKDRGTFNDLQFTMTDTNGKTCVARLTTGGKETNVQASFFNYEDYDWEQVDGSWENVITDYTNNWMVPEKINVAISQDGTQIASVDVTTSFSGDGEFITQQSANISSTVKVNNYQVTLNKVAASNRSADVDLTVNVDGKDLLQVSGTAVGSFTEDKDGDVDVSLGNTTAAADVMGEVQVYFQTSNLSTLHSMISDFNDDNYMSKSRATSLADQMNNMMSARLCFDKNTVESATAFFSPYLDYGNESNGYWDLMPTLKFTADGREVAFEDYFTESNFKSVTDTYNRLVDSFERMFDI